MKKPLTVVEPDHQAAAAPPVGLGEAGLKLWRAVTAEYLLADIGGLTLLEQAARALDRAAACERQIDAEGAVVSSRGSTRDHPLLRHETANRALAVRILGKLGLDLEPVKSVGRPGGSIGIRWDR